MEKRKYYVTVGSGEILPDKTLSEWEFEIDATLKEAKQLEELFIKVNNLSWDNFWKAHVPIQKEPEGTLTPYDITLHHIYKMIYMLGTETTKEHIRSMGILH